jgi:hypothetical protein
VLAYYYYYSGCLNHVQPDQLPFSLFVPPKDKRASQLLLAHWPGNQHGNGLSTSGYMLAAAPSSPLDDRYLVISEY